MVDSLVTVDRLSRPIVYFSMYFSRNSGFFRYSGHFAADGGIHYYERRLQYLKIKIDIEANLLDDSTLVNTFENVIKFEIEKQFFQGMACHPIGTQRVNKSCSTNCIVLAENQIRFRVFLTQKIDLENERFSIFQDLCKICMTCEKY